MTMKNTLIALTAVAGLISLNAPAQAGGCHTKSCAPKQSYHKPHYQPQHYHQTYDYQPKHSHYEPQHSHVSYLPGHTKDFSHQCDLGKYGCKGFYSTQHKDWFYFYPQKNVYLPVKFIQQLPPVANFNQNDNRNVNANDNDNRNKNVNQNITNITIAPVAPVGAGPVVPLSGPVAPTGLGPAGPVGAGPVAPIEVQEGPIGLGPNGPTGVGTVGAVLPLPPG